MKRTRGRGYHCHATWLILVLEILFNFQIDMQCVEKAISKISFHILWNLEHIWHSWHTWVISKGLRTVGLIGLISVIRVGFATWQGVEKLFFASLSCLTHWGRVMHICISNLTIIGPDNGLGPGRRQAIIRINAAILLIEPLWTNFSEILIGIQTFSFKKMHLKMSSAKWRLFCLGLNVLTVWALGWNE